MCMCVPIFFPYKLSSSPSVSSADDAAVACASNGARLWRPKDAGGVGGIGGVGGGGGRGDRGRDGTEGVLRALEIGGIEGGQIIVGELAS